jgi:hypothetical protein
MAISRRTFMKVASAIALPYHRQEALALQSGSPFSAESANWRLQITNITCSPDVAVLTVELDIRYIGATGPVERPLVSVVDLQGREYVPASVPRQQRADARVLWIMYVANDAVLRFEQGQAFSGCSFVFNLSNDASGLQLHFADIDPFPIVGYRYSGFDEFRAQARNWKTHPPQIRPRNDRPADGLTIPIYVGVYPCQPADGSVQVTSGSSPPYLPERVLMWGLGYLPNYRAVKLSRGQCPVRSYMHNNTQTTPSQDAVRGAVCRDFPEFCSASLVTTGDQLIGAERHFVYVFGLERGRFQRRLLSLGIYRIRACE